MPADEKHSARLLHFHPRACAGRDRILRFGPDLVRVTSTTPLLLHRWRSPRKPGPFIADASIPEPGERVELVGRPGIIGTVVI